MNAPSNPANRGADDYLGRDDLLALGLDPDEADAVLALSGLTGHDRRPCVEALGLDDLLALVWMDAPLPPDEGGRS